MKEYLINPIVAIKSHRAPLLPLGPPETDDWPTRYGGTPYALPCLTTVTSHCSENRSRMLALRSTSFASRVARRHNSSSKGFTAFGAPVGGTKDLPVSPHVQIYDFPLTVELSPFFGLTSSSRPSHRLRRELQAEPWLLLVLCFVFL